MTFASGILGTPPSVLGDGHAEKILQVIEGSD
jgi:hypothetical protein